jgi:hypothetical protein
VVKGGERKKEKVKELYQLYVYRRGDVLVVEK